MTPDYAAELMSGAVAGAVRAATAAERARCAAVSRGVEARYRGGACPCEECGGRSDGARECAEAIERGDVGR